MARILYVTSDNSRNPASENNGFFLGQALEDTTHEVIRYSHSKMKAFEKAILGPVKLGYRLGGHDFRSSVEPLVLKRRALELNRCVQSIRPDVVLANSPAAVAGIDQSIPYVVYTDSPVSQLVGMGHYYDKWPERSRRLFQDLDRRTLLGARKAIYHTRWAADAAVKDYRLPKERVDVVLPGANIRFIDRSHSNTQKPKGVECHLLFWGRDWERKGGPLAVDIAKRLIERGMDVRLTICGPGALPASVNELPFVRYLGYMSKDTREAVRQIEDLFQSADYMLLPTRADASTSAIREACAFGVPPVVTAVGGLSEMVGEGRGLALPGDALADSFAEAIQRNFIDEKARLDMRWRARQQYETCLNWPCAVTSLLEKLFVTPLDRR